jgi:dihydroorotase
VFDQLIRGGTIFDGEQLRPADVALQSGQVVAVGAELGPARNYMEAEGLLVCPGLIDLHAHSFVGAKYPGVDPDRMAASSGVLTVADPGSAPLMHFDAFLAELAERRTHVLPFLSQYRDWHVLASLEERRQAIRRYRNQIHGLKVIVFPDEDGEGGLQTLREGRSLADEFALTLMVHYTVPSAYAAEAVSLLRRGDILAHLFWSFDGGLYGPDGDLSALFVEVQQRGVVIDVAHGGGKFRFDVARRAIELGFFPNTISTDLHAGCVDGPVYDLPTTASKLLNLGMPLEPVLKAITSRPAQALGLTTEGRIAPGLPARIALLRVEDGQFDFVDAAGETLVGRQRLAFVRTLEGD